MEEDLNKVGMQALLDKIGALNFKYKKLKDEDDFNIFPILKNPREEVSLHSRFIFELLNPEGTHRKGNAFLKSFLETVEIKDFDMDVVKVHREHQYIDILITNNQKQAIIIENKLGAGDQDRQLQRYYEKMKNQGYEKIWLIYLSLREDGPSDNSLGDLPEDVKKELIAILYFPHISKWLEKCIEKSSKKPALRETIIQYENLIKEITDQTMSKEHIEKVYDLLVEGENIHSAKTIVSNWNHVRWYLERDFWEAFEKIIPKEYQILDFERWSYDKLDSVIHSGKNKTRYGITLELFLRDGNKFCLLIGRGDHRLFYEIAIYRIGEKSSEEEKGTEEEYQKFADGLKEKGPTEWLWGRPLQRQNINFGALTPETLDLIDEKKREESLKNIWAEIKEFIERVYKVKAKVLDKST